MPVRYLYNLFVKSYSGAIRLAARWNKKADAWVEGRKDVFVDLQNTFSPGDRLIWMHCSSAGEFEQGKPVLEALKNHFPSKKILVTFFSPSGYQVAKSYPHADMITYLPVDTRKNAERFYQLVKPELAIFVKYEFWYHHLSVMAFHHTPILLISAVFRKDQVFFKSYGGFFRQMLHLFRHISVQDQASLLLLQAADIRHGSVSGDTRFDRVMKIREQTDIIPFIDDFIAGKKVIVAGSTWPGDEEMLAQYLRQQTGVKLIIAPHEINAAHIEKVQALFPDSVTYSDLKKRNPSKKDISVKQTLIIDAVGLLSRLYQSATITYVGGGFTKDGIHNILEAAVWAKPVLFGPNYQKYREAKEMITAGGAFSVATVTEIKKIADDLLGNENHLQKIGLKAKAYIEDNTGATNKIVQAIQENRLLTN
jgi:3-deoxy-D-manno-octulosonic-acid transferase